MAWLEQKGESNEKKSKKKKVYFIPEKDLFHRPGERERERERSGVQMENFMTQPDQTFHDFKASKSINS